MQKQERTGERPPIVVVVGHIDHGKSTLLDYIRKSNTAEGEAGGITQHLSAYETFHTTSADVERRITFLDTPGHAAFEAMRSRGLEAADVAILVVSAEDGVKPQTLEAVKLIEIAKIPFIVALTKIDKPTANIERTKMSLLEHGIYLEGLGGDVAYVGVSSKTGEGIPELLDLILLAAELEGLSADTTLSGTGLVIEAHMDQKRGNTATLIVKNGSIEHGEYIVCGESYAPVRIMENYLGKNTKEALPGSPVQIVGFSSLPDIGAAWHTVESKKEAETDITSARLERLARATTPSPWSDTSQEEHALHIVLPIVIKTDFAGTGDAVLHELRKLPEDPRMEVRVVGRSVGHISENDVRLVGASTPAGIIIGFNTKIDADARQLADRLGVTIGTFDIIYKLTEWLQQELETRHPRENKEDRVGLAKILKVFSYQQGRVVLGGRVEDGWLATGAPVKLLRGEEEIGRGEILSLQEQKEVATKVERGKEFGAMIRLSKEPALGDHIETFEIIFR